MKATKNTSIKIAYFLTIKNHFPNSDIYNLWENKANQKSENVWISCRVPEYQPGVSVRPRVETFNACARSAGGVAAIKVIICHCQTLCKLQPRSWRGNRESPGKTPHLLVTCQIALTKSPLSVWRTKDALINMQHYQRTPPPVALATWFSII